MNEKSYHPFSIIRIWSEQFTDPIAWKEMFSFLTKYKGVCDEVWFCTLAGYPSLEDHKACAEKLKEAMQDCRQVGILPGLQIGNTVGHADQNWYDNAAIAELEKLVNHDGHVAASCFCPRGEKFQNYNKEMTTAYAEYKPSSIWIDDDLRMNSHGPVSYACFCDECIQGFSSVVNRKYERESLVKELNSVDGGKTRLAWTRFNENSIADISSCIAQAAHDASPDTIMAIQTCPSDFSLYNGNNYSNAFEVMHEITGLPVGSRPGVGVYNDHEPRKLITKAFHTGRAAAMHPDCVSICSAEIENSPHMLMGKTPQGTAVEATLHLALGCNSISFAAFCNGYEPLRHYEPLMSKLLSYRPFWDQAMSDAQDTVPGGIYVNMSDQHVVRPLMDNEAPFAWANLNLNKIYNLANFGLPLTPDPLGAQACMLSEESIKGFDDSELENIFKSGVILDGAAALYLQDQGLGHLLGTKVKRFLRDDSQEVFTDDELVSDLENGFCRIANTNNYQIVLNDKVRALSEYYSQNNHCHGIASALVENSIGGRVAIYGRGAWDTIISAAFRARALRVANWACNERLPAYISSPVQAVVIPRVDKVGDLRGVFILNNTIDETGPFTMLLSDDEFEHGHLYRPGGADAYVVRPNKEGCGFELPSIAPWSVVWVAFER